MELNAWRNAVSYGAYIQPIHLKVAGSDASHISESSAQKSPSQSVQNSHQTRSKTTEIHLNGTPIVSQLLEARTGQIRAQNEAESMEKTTGITVIPPYTSECLNNGEQMALNVGGPVWAMDWLPSKARANPVAVAADSIETKQKKAQRVSGAVKTGAKKALRGKENIKTETSQDVDGDTTAAFTGSLDTKEDITVEWKFLALATHPPCQVEEEIVVKSTPPDHYYDVAESARNLIQIWAVPVQRPIAAGVRHARRSKTAKRQLVKPRLVYAIDHESGVAWDMQWCPLVKKFPKACRRDDTLGILAVCFGDGSVKVFEIPAILEERLQPELIKETDCVVEKNILIVVGKLPRIMQLSVQWSPHNWMLLTGASDGSVSLWNIETAVKESRSSGITHAQPEPIEPQRRFQDADTIGKQEAFDWGCGWVAIRAVAWSPFDEHLFATTGNDSVFKVWDVREPRVCLRSHRIRSTWGLALQWMDQTSIQISGDQGSVFMYDILSGSYQKLHFHPQIDSPVWDLQFARRGAVPLLVSSCTSGSIRAAPAKKLYRAPQNCLEICRLSGEKDSTIEKPFKSLTVSFEKHSILGNADSGSQNTREFCERDAALHRLRLSSSTAGEYPCFLAAGGHAGLVILLELQEVLDTLITNFFLPPTKKIGRPKKIFATVGGHHVPKKGPSKQVGSKAKAMISAGRKARTLGSFAKAKGMHTALSKYKKKPPNADKGKAKAKSRAKSQRKSFIQEDGQVEVDNSVEEEEEPEFEEEDEEEDESDLSLLMGDSSDDDRISVSDDDVEEEAKASTPNANPEEARLMKEYQLDLSEEDAYLLALQMSKAGDAPAASAPETGTDTPSSLPTPVVQEKPQQKGSSAKASATVKRKARARRTTTKAIVGTKRKPAAKSGTDKKCAGSTSTMPETAAVPVVAEASHDTSIEANQKSEVQPDDSGEPEFNAPDKVIADERRLVVATALAAENEKPVAIDAESSATIPKKIEIKSKQPNKALATKTSPRSKRESPMLLKAINKAMDLQAFEYQMGMSEEDALKEAIRLSEIGGKRRSSRAKQPVSLIPSEPIGGALPTLTQPKQTPATPRTKGPFQMRQKKVEEPKEKVQTSDAGAVSADEDAQRQWPQTPRRLQFSPRNSSESGDQAGVPTANIDSDNPAAKSAPPEVDAAASTAVAPEKEPSPQKSPGVKSSKTESKLSATSASSGMETPMKTEEKKQVKSTSTARCQKQQLATASAATPKGNKSAKRPKSTGAKAAGPAKKRKKTTTTSRSGRRSSTGAAHGDIMSEEDAFLLALKMSEIEY